MTRGEVWLLDRGATSWENTAIHKELSGRGFRVSVIDREQLALSGVAQDVIYDGTPVPAPRVAVVNSRFITRRRPHTDDLTLTYDLLHSLTDAGTRVTNETSALIGCRNKLRQASTLARAGIPVPETRAVSSQKDIEACMADWGDVIIKPVWGHASWDVMRMSPGGRLAPEGSLLGIREEITTWHLLSENGTMLCQPYVPNPNRDLRVTVIGRTIASCVFHVSTSPDGAVRHFQHPLRVEAAEPSREVATLCLDAVGALGLDAALIDLVEGPDGPVIIEVNEGLPVWRDIEDSPLDLTPNGHTALVADHLEQLALGAPTSASHGGASQFIP